VAKKIGTEFCLDEDLNLGGLGVHPRPTELGSDHTFLCHLSDIPLVLLFMGSFIFFLAGDDILPNIIQSFDV